MNSQPSEVDVIIVETKVVEEALKHIYETFMKQRTSRVNLDH